MLVNIHEAKTHFSQLIKKALQGEEIIIAKGGDPLIILTPYHHKLAQRKGGQLKDLMQIAPDFDATLPKNIVDSFYTKDL